MSRIGEYAELIGLVFLIVIALLSVFVLVSCGCRADISEQSFYNGDGVISKSHQMYEISAPTLGTGFITSQQDFYQNGGSTSRIVSNGQTGMQRDVTSDASRSISMKTRVQTTARIQVSESGGIYGTQTNISPTQCDSGGDGIIGSGIAGRMPETQMSTSFVGLMGNGDGTEYEATMDVSDKILDMEADGATPEGVMYQLSQGFIEAGFDTNTTARQYFYKQDAIDVAWNPTEGHSEWHWERSVGDLAVDEGLYPTNAVNETDLSNFEIEE